MGGWVGHFADAGVERPPQLHAAIIKNIKCNQNVSALISL